MLIIGLTGGIGSGKTTVSDHFSHLGVPVIDADRITRELVRPGAPALTRIIEHFGTTILLPSGDLDRAALRRRIFAHPADREFLEAILHPLTREEIRRRIRLLDAPYCIVSIPLLFESGWEADVDRVLVIDSAVTEQIARTCRRDGISREEVLAIIERQLDRDSRLAAADDIIGNDADLPALHARIEALHAKYLQLAQPGNAV